MNRERGPIGASAACLVGVLWSVGCGSAPPQEGLWALPGGRWDGTESLDDSASRKLVEETGVRNLYLEQLFTTSGLDAANPSVAVAYFALVDAPTVRLRQTSEWPPAWHPVAALPGLAFENNRVIAQAMARVRAKLDYTNIAYSLLPEQFTLRELQRTYEAILDVDSVADDAYRGLERLLRNQSQWYDLVAIYERKPPTPGR